MIVSETLDGNSLQVISCSLHCLVCTRNSPSRAFCGIQKPYSERTVKTHINKDLSKMGLRTGAIAFTLMPKLSSNAPSERVNPLIACLLAKYSGVGSPYACPAMEEVSTTRFGLLRLALSFGSFAKFGAYISRCFMLELTRIKDYDTS
jgi:hypothetical protein